MTRIYDFRLRFTPSPRDTLNSDAYQLDLPTLQSTHEVVLKPREADRSIREAGSMVLHGSGWKDADDAECVGAFYADVLSRTYARLRLGADFGSRAAKSVFTEAGLALLGEKTGRPRLNDVHGLMIYEKTSRPNLVFMTMQVDLTRGVSVEQFLSVFEVALSRPRNIDDRERVALELFNVSFFQASVDSRFLLLMSGLEALIAQNPRSEEVGSLVSALIATVDANTQVSEGEQNAIKQALGQLRRESISQSGRRLVSESLDGKTYGGIDPAKFFSRSYRLRSRLVHGELPFPSRAEVSSAAAQLEVMLSDLLSVDLLDVGPGS